MTMVSGRSAGDRFVDDFEHVRVGGHAHDDDVAERCEVGELGDGRAAGFLGERLWLWRQCDSRRR